jgi:hypothetical protein
MKSMSDEPVAKQMTAKRATAKEVIDMLDHAAHMAYRLTLGGVPPWMAAVGRRMAKPRIGDLVAETSTYYRARRAGRESRAYDYHAGMRIGRLLRDVREPVAMEWDEAEDGPRPTERVFYIMGLDGNEHRWTNASFVAIPEAAWEKQIEVDEEEVRRFQAGR